jgi:molybdate transport system substrate-binding protein
MTTHLLKIALACLTSLSFLASPAQAQDDVPIIAAASTLQFAIPEIVAAFEAETGMQVRLTFGSSGNFARQIREGAPFQMFLAANESYVLDLAEEGLTQDDGRLYAQGRIVLIAPHGSTLALDEGLDGLAAALSEGRITRFAIANPDHAPYGMRAMEALQHRQLWDALQPVVVLGENISQAAQFATTGNADGGIIAYSLALAPQVSALATYVLIPADWHEPLNQRMVLLNDAGPVAEAFYAYMTSPEAQTIMARYGYVAPGE